MITDGRTGLLVPAEDVGAFVDAVEQLVRNPSLRKELGSAAADASTAYDWDRLLGSVLDPYLSMR